jgi:hypothetical protein
MVCLDWQSWVHLRRVAYLLDLLYNLGAFQLLIRSQLVPSKRELTLASRVEDDVAESLARCELSLILRLILF